MKKEKNTEKNLKEQKLGQHRRSLEGRLLLLIPVMILLVIAYTYILQRSYTRTALKTEIERDISSADAVHKLVNDRLSKKDFTEIRSKDDENTELYQTGELSYIRRNVLYRTICSLSDTVPMILSRSGEHAERIGFHLFWRVKRNFHLRIIII